jgi:hypothetical protein
VAQSAWIALIQIVATGGNSNAIQADRAKLRYSSVRSINQ